MNDQKARGQSRAFWLCRCLRGKLSERVLREPHESRIGGFRDHRLERRLRPNPSGLAQRDRGVAAHLDALVVVEMVPDLFDQFWIVGGRSPRRRRGR